MRTTDPETSDAAVGAEDGRRDVDAGAVSDRALLLLDLTLARFRGDAAVEGARDIIRFVQGELRYFRERGRPVIFAKQLDDDVVIQELTPRSDELVLERTAPSAFFGTGLDLSLRRHHVRRLTIVGLQTHTSVLLTAADAWAHGYEVVVPEPCVCAADAEAHAFALRLLREGWVAPARGKAGAA